MSNKQTLNIQILTPVHVGSGEGKLIENLDYFCENNNLNIIDWGKMLSIENSNDILNESKQLADAILKKNIDIIKTRAKNRKAFTSYLNTQIFGTEIFPNIKTKLSKKPIIPGSSIKGSIVSILLNHFLNGNRPRSINMEEYFGKPSNGTDFRRIIQISDVEFDTLCYINSKIFNLMDDNEDFSGGWKNSNKSTREFNKHSFVFTYESIPCNANSKIHLEIKTDLYKISPIHKNETKDTIASNNINHLFRIINNHTKNFIEKEIKFHEEYNQAEHSGKILAQWENLLKITNEAIENNNSYCILRVGGGSGFHGITGDWQFDTHLIDDLEAVKLRNGKILHYRGTWKGKLSAKTRKFAFWYENNTLRLMPFGFVKIGLFKVPTSNNNHKRQEKAKNTAANNPNFSKFTESNNTSNPPQSPTYQSIQRLKQNDIVLAEVISNQRPNVIIKPYIEELKDKNFSIRYPAGLESGRVIKVRITNLNKNNLSTINFSFHGL